MFLLWINGREGEETMNILLVFITVGRTVEYG